MTLVTPNKKLAAFYHRQHSDGSMSVLKIYKILTTHHYCTALVRNMSTEYTKRKF